MTVEAGNTAPGTDKLLRERLRVLLRATIAVNQSLNPEDIAQAALWLAFDIADLRLGTVWLFQNHQRVTLASQGWTPEQFKQLRDIPIPPGETFIERCWQEKEAVILEDLSTIPQDDLLRLLRSFDLKAVVAIPLTIPEDVRGVMLLGDQVERQFSLSDVDFLTEIARLVSACLRNAWLYVQSQRQLKDLRAITEAAQTVISSLDTNQILVRIMNEVTNHLNVEAAALLLLIPDRQELEFAAVAGPESENLKGVRLPLGQGIVGWVAQHKKPVVVRDVNRDPRFKDLAQKTGTVAQSILCVPLQVRDQLIGVVEVLNKRVGAFTASDERMLSLLGTFVAVAIENARVFEESNLQLEQATIYARDLRTSFVQERQQRKAMDQLRYSFLNVVGHELMSPMAVVLQSIEALKNPRRGELNHDQQEILKSLEDQAQHLNRLIDGLSTFARFSARQGAMTFEWINFQVVLDEAVQMAEFKAARKDIRVKNFTPGQLPDLHLDKARMVEAIEHLLDNAIKYSPPGSEVQVRSDVIDETLVVHIMDEGFGIAADQIEHIWDSFVQMNTTLERGLEGLGLGLAIARYMVEAHNGTITVQSEPDRGSIFSINLPIT